MSKKILLLIYIGLCGALTSCTTSDKDEGKAGLYLQIGNDLMAQNNYPEALSNLLLAQKHAPDNPVILNSLGMLYLARDKYKTAEEYVKKAVIAEPKYTDARTNLGRVYIAQGKYKKAIIETKKALKDLTYTQPEKAQTNLGLAYLRINKFKEAKTQLSTAIKLNKEYCPAYNYYGQTLMKLKDFESASGIFDRAIRVCQNSPEEAHYLSGLSYYQSGKSNMAITRFKEVAKLYPTSEYAEKSRSLLKVIEQDKK